MDASAPIDSNRSANRPGAHPPDHTSELEGGTSFDRHGGRGSGVYDRVIIQTEGERHGTGGGQIRGAVTPAVESTSRRHSFPPEGTGVYLAPTRTRSRRHSYPAATAPTRERSPASSIESLPNKRRRGSAAKCGKLVCGDTTGWQDPCDACTGSHTGHKLCCACHMGPVQSASMKPIWNHLQDDAAIAKSKELWSIALAKPIPFATVVKDGFQPTSECLCNRATCYFRLTRQFEAERERSNAKACAACGTNKTTAFRKPCSKLGLMNRWFSSGASRGDRLRRTGGVLDAGCDICNKCYLEFRDKGEAAMKDTWKNRPSVKEYLTFFELSPPPAEKTVELTSHLMQIYILRTLGEGRMVYLDDGIASLRRARSEAGLSDVTDKTLRSEALQIFKDLGRTLLDASFVSYDGSHVGDDSRTKAQYIVPQKFDYLYIIGMHRSEWRLECEVKRLRALVAGRTDKAVGGERAAPTAPLQLVEEAGRIVCEDIRGYSKWRNNKRDRSKREDLNVDMQETVSYVRKEFPPSLALFLREVCGFDESLFTSANDAAGDQTRSERRNSLLVYMLGTMIAKAVIGECYMPPHALKLSQAMKMRGVGAKPMAFFASINICMSDSQRHNREEHTLHKSDRQLMPADPRVAVAVAWDNNDTDPTARFASAEHAGNIGATGHYQAEASSPPMVLGLEDKWLPKEELSMDVLLTGRPRARHHETLSNWNHTLFKSLGNGPTYLTSSGDERSCLEAELRKNLTVSSAEVVSKNLFIMPGSTKCEQDCQAAMDRLEIITHAREDETAEQVIDGAFGNILRRVLAEGDEETYRYMMNLKRSHPEKNAWVFPHPGGWHIMLHMTKALVLRYWGAGIECVANILGGDDRHAAAGNNYRRSHHFLTVMFESLWCVIIELYTAEAAESWDSNDEAIAARESLDVERKVVPWLRKRAEGHVTLRFWLAFLLEDYPAYLGFRFAGRIGDYRLRTACLRHAAHLFTITGKNRYQQLCAWHVGDVSRMTDEDFLAVSSLFTASFSGKDFARVHLDEYQEMSNRSIKAGLAKITPAFMSKLPPIIEYRQLAVQQVDEYFYQSYADRDPVPGLIRDRAGAVEKVLSWVRTCPAFTDEGKDRLVSLSGSVANKKDADEMLHARELGIGTWKKVLRTEAMGKKDGQKPSQQKLAKFPPQNVTSTATKTPVRKIAAQTEYKDMSLVAKEFWQILKRLLHASGSHTAGMVGNMTQHIGAVLPMAMAHAGEGGGRKGKKADGLHYFIRKFCSDAQQETPFYPVDAMAVDMATELHRPPGANTLSQGSVALADHYRRLTLTDYMYFGNTTKLVALCYDISALVPPIKASEQAARRLGNRKCDKEFNPMSTESLPSKSYQSFLRVGNNRDRIAAAVGERILSHPDGKGRNPDATILMLGMSPQTTAEPSQRPVPAPGPGLPRQHHEETAPNPPIGTSREGANILPEVEHVAPATGPHNPIFGGAGAAPFLRSFPGGSGVAATAGNLAAAPAAVAGGAFARMIAPHNLPFRGAGAAPVPGFFLGGSPVAAVAGGAFARMTYPQNLAFRGAGAATVPGLSPRGGASDSSAAVATRTASPRMISPQNLPFGGVAAAPVPCTFPGGSVSATALAAAGARMTSAQNVAFGGVGAATIPGLSPHGREGGLAAASTATAVAATATTTAAVVSSRPMAPPCSGGRDDQATSRDGVEASSPGLQMRVWGSGKPISLEGPGIGEGELSATHIIIHYRLYTKLENLRRWMVTSIDSDQIVHILLAFATGHIASSGEDKVSVTVRQRKTNGKANFVDINRIYDSVCTGPMWKTGGEIPDWLTHQARVVLYVVLYFLGGCDFLPHIYNMTFAKMFPFVVETIAEPGLFPEAIVYPRGGRWCVNVEECVKMLGVCYFQLHFDVFGTVYPGGAAKMFTSPEIGGKIPKFLEAVRAIIWEAKGQHGKKNCPHWDALVLQANRADAVLEYFQSAFEKKAAPVSFQGRGWATESGKPGEEITRENVVVQLSQHALLEKGGRVKLLTCSCKPDKAAKHKCKSCTCGKMNKPCVFGYCKCGRTCQEVALGGPLPSDEVNVDGNGACLGVVGNVGHEDDGTIGGVGRSSEDTAAIDTNLSCGLGAGDGDRDYDLCGDSSDDGGRV